jgi:ABC-type Mn2+/Zn2+ transport system permease subunit
VISWFTDAFASELAQRALVAGLLAVITTSIVGTWVVIRGLTFFSEALAHGVLPGVALAVVWEVDLVLGALASAAVMVAGVGIVSRRTRLREDVAIGLLFVGMLALGVIIISKKGSYAGDLSHVLFGDILGVKPSDVRLQAAVAVVAIASLVLYRPLLALSFNRSKAALLGLRPTLTHFALLSLIALSIVASFRAVGTLLVFGLLVAPPATGSLLARRVPMMMATGVAVGVVSVTLGLTISYHAGTAASATMAGTAVGVFFVVLVVREAMNLVSRRAF